LGCAFLKYIGLTKQEFFDEYDEFLQSEKPPYAGPVMKEYYENPRFG
jgi:hypothetical protein